MSYIKTKLIYLRYFFYRYILSKKFYNVSLNTFVDINEVMLSTYSTFYGYYDFIINNNNGHTIFLEENDLKLNIIVKKADKYITLGTTKSWNFQQGCMLSWFDKSKTQIIFNEFDESKNAYFSKVLDLNGKLIQEFDFPIQTIGLKSKLGLSINYDRLSVLRPEYGYSCKTNIVLDDENDGIWVFSLNKSFNSKLIIKLSSLKLKENLKSNIIDQKVNHLVFNNEETFFIFLYRFKIGLKRFHRLYLSDIHGNVTLLSNNMVSHYTWLDNENVVFFGENENHELGYYIINIKSKKIKLISKKLPKADGHPVVINENYLIFDTYPALDRFSKLFLFDIKNDNLIQIGEFYQPFYFIGSKRVDLHPKLSFDNNICYIESAHKNNITTLYAIIISNLITNE